jgi:FKBP-type peptidyl-prolyl cis-trans isomerase
VGCRQETPATAQTQQVELVTEENKLAYGEGYSTGREFRMMMEQLRAQGVDTDPQAFVEGFRHAMMGDTARVTDAEIQQAQRAVQDTLVARRDQRGSLNLQQNQAFFAQNAQRDSVETTGSGLQYKVVQPGQGPRPQPTDRVTVHYRGTLLDGTEFDSSYERGQPVTIPVQGVIPGWQEGLQLMQRGATYRFFIPPDLAYGDEGAGTMIAPNQALIFDVELLDISSGQQQFPGGMGQFNQ